ncbi:hypothetical protein [Aeromicrobium massiliense]|uniref:hypothetical protein n=1 Tax=Aeromicrobium massiliense TaxID=1464554 RepID=UPI0005786165|nr:hypothetical protein [Aeromicrobium massiliense]
MSTYPDAADDMLVRRVHLFAGTQAGDVVASAEAVIFTDAHAQQRARYWFKEAELEHFRRLILGDAPVSVRTPEPTTERWESSLAYLAHEKALPGLALLEDGVEADYLTIRSIGFELGRLRGKLVRAYATIHRTAVVRDGDQIVFTLGAAARAAETFVGWAIRSDDLPTRRPTQASSSPPRPPCSRRPLFRPVPSARRSKRQRRRLPNRLRP